MFSLSTGEEESAELSAREGVETREGKERCCTMGRLAAGLAVGCAVAACVVATVMVGRRVRRRKKWRKVLRVLEELEEACATPVGRLRQVVDAMAVEMHAGLASEGGSKLKMLLTYVDKLPNGYILVHLIARIHINAVTV